MENNLRVAIVGGNERTGPEYPSGTDIRRYGSSRYGGNGDLRQVLAAIASGGVDAVIILVRWLGHPASGAVRASCRRWHVPCSIVTGGESAARRAIIALLERRSGR